MSDAETISGIFNGYWSAWIARLDINGHEVDFETPIGVRGINIACVAKVVNGVIAEIEATGNSVPREAREA